MSVSTFDCSLEGADELQQQEMGSVWQLMSRSRGRPGMIVDANKEGKI